MIGRRQLVKELEALGISAKQAARATGWYPWVKGERFTYADPIEAIERYCELNSKLTDLGAKKAAKQISEMIG